MNPGDIYQTPDGTDAVVLHVDGDTAWIRPVRSHDGGRLVTAADLEQLGAVQVPPLDVETNHFDVRHDVQVVAGRQIPGISITIGPDSVFLRPRRAVNLASWIVAHVDPQLVHLRRARDNYVDPVDPPTPDPGSGPAAPSVPTSPIGGGPAGGPKT